MKIPLSKYKEIVSLVRLHQRGVVFEKVKEAHPTLLEETLGSIIAQEFQRHVKRTYYRHCAPKNLQIYYRDYCEKASKEGANPGIILQMADEYHFSPALMARMILEKHLTVSAKSEEEMPTKSSISNLMKNTHLIEDGFLALEVYLCVLNDTLYGAISDVVKSLGGNDQEVRLKKELEELGLTFVDENVLRERGYDKTPDIKLDIPFAVDGHIVNWVESKASFGDEECHRGYLKDQYWSYCNRFGSGLVIYWYGFIEELDVNKSQGIMLASSLPRNITKMDPLASMSFG